MSKQAKQNRLICKMPSNNFCSVKKCPFNDKLMDRLYYPFPKDNNRCLKWISNLRSKEIEQILLQRGSIFVSKNFAICSKHFEESEFEGVNRRQLKVTAIPTLNIPICHDQQGHSLSNKKLNSKGSSFGRIFQITPPVTSQVSRPVNTNGMKKITKLLYMTSNRAETTQNSGNVSSMAVNNQPQSPLISLLSQPTYIYKSPTKSLSSNTRNKATPESSYKISSKTIEIAPIKYESNENNNESPKEYEKDANEISQLNIIGQYINLKKEQIEESAIETSTETATETCASDKEEIQSTKNSEVTSVTSSVKDSESNKSQDASSSGPKEQKESHDDVNNNDNDNDNDINNENENDIDNDIIDNINDTNNDNVNDDDSAEVFTQVAPKKSTSSTELAKIKRLNKTIKAKNLKYQKKIIRQENHIKHLKRRQKIQIAAIRQKSKKTKKLLVAEAIRNCRNLLPMSQQAIVENILLASVDKTVNIYKEPIKNLAMNFYNISPKAYQYFRKLLNFPSVNSLRKWKKDADKTSLKTEVSDAGEMEKKPGVKKEMLSISILEEIEAEINR